MKDYVQINLKIVTSQENQRRFSRWINYKINIF